MEIEERFWSKVDWTLDEDRCWPWTAGCRDEYGSFSVAGRNAPAHRIAYELEVGEVPDGYVIDHVKDRGCITTLCCNPDHLEVVTNRENILRGTGPSAENSRKTHCSRHGERLALLYAGSTKRRCRTCWNEQNRSHQRRRRAAGLG